jgi:uncharacterized protein YjiS (DUF1127 family)
MTTVVLFPGAGIIPKHARDRFSPTTTLREKSMSVAKHLSYARSRSRTERPRRIDGPSLIYSRALAQQASSSPRSAIVSVSVAPRSILRTAARYTESAGDILLIAASWMFMQILEGCVAYAVSMHGIPEAAVRGESGEPKPPAPPARLRNSSRHGLHISAHKIGDISAVEILSSPRAAQACASVKSTARSEQTPGARSGWRTAIMTLAVLPLSKIRERQAWQRAVAELQNLDDRSLSDIGITRADIGYVARHAVRLE